MISPLAGTLSLPNTLTDISALLKAYTELVPSFDNTAHRIAFGTSGHRGTPAAYTFNEAHILAITQAICDIRLANDLHGPLFIGMDTHALSEVALKNTVEIAAANHIEVYLEENSPYTPTPVISHAILAYNRLHHGTARADGIIVTPSHNPPSDGGIKYNPPTGGPAPTTLTKEIENRANAILARGNRDVRRLTYSDALASGHVHHQDFIGQYIEDLHNVLNLEIIAESGLKIAVDPFGGSTIDVWGRLSESYKLPIEITNHTIDPTFSFVPLDHDGKIRMDCSSRFAMGGLLALQNNYDLAFACDPDADRHGIVTHDGLMNPNHYLSVSVWHLCKSRTNWPNNIGIGKTVVTSSMLNRVAQAEGKPIYEVPVGFKWFVPYLMNATCGMGCEESAGASFLRFDGLPWSTDKDGPLMCLLSAEIMTTYGKSPSEIYSDLTHKFGTPAYSRADTPLDPSKRTRFAQLTASSLQSDTLAGEKITSVLTHAPANNEPIGGLKVSTDNGWFAVRPSGTEPICKVYTESFLGEEHRQRIEQDATSMLNTLLG